MESVGSGDYGGGGPEPYRGEDSTPTSHPASCSDFFGCLLMTAATIYGLYLAYQFIVSFFF